MKTGVKVAKKVTIFGENIRPGQFHPYVKTKALEKFSTKGSTDISWTTFDNVGQRRLVRPSNLDSWAIAHYTFATR